MQRIERGEVHLWYCLADDVVSQPKLIAACQRLLSQEELDGLARRRRPEVWAEFLVTRALVRATLSAYTTIPPSALRFSTDRRGRPKLDHRDVGMPLDFNISHTTGIVVLAVANASTIGVDVEPLDRDLNVIELLDAKIFNNAERRWILQEDGRRRFLHLWTLKEAWAKARGYGLSDRLCDAHFEVSDEGAIKFQFPVDWNESPLRWVFDQYVIERRFMLALAAGCVSGTAIFCKPLRTIPFCAENS
jgi:4'-phosphopantetheinyl transferase